MRLNEFATQLNEMPFGSSHGFRGYGQGVFRQAFYQSIASAVSELRDEQVKEFLTHWFVDLFKKDNYKFKPDVFTKAALSSYYPSRGRAVFQQRHLWYLAHHVRQIADVHAREFVAKWLGDHVASTNSQFRRALWDRACGVNEPEEPDTLPARRGGRRERPNTLGFHDVPDTAPGAALPGPRTPPEEV